MPPLQRVVSMAGLLHLFRVDGLKRRKRMRRLSVILQTRTAKSCLLGLWHTWLTLLCLSRDPRVIRILANTDYWLFILLDPRYKENFSSLIPVVERSRKMVQYQKVLVEKLLQKFAADNAGSRVCGSLGNRGGETRGTHSSSNRGRGIISKTWDSLMTPCEYPHPDARPSVTRREKFWKMVKEYVADRVSVPNDPSVPYYRVSKLDTWHELALYTLEVLACLAASI